MQRMVVGALLVALALGVAACGDASKPLTAGQLRAQASAICHDTIRQVETLQRNLTQATARRFMARVAAVQAGGVARLRALAAPPRLAAGYERLVGLLEARRDAARALSHPGKALTARQRDVVSTHHNPIGPAARRLGVDGCV